MFTLIDFVLIGLILVSCIGAITLIRRKKGHCSCGCSDCTGCPHNKNTSSFH